MMKSKFLLISLVLSSFSCGIVSLNPNFAEDESKTNKEEPEAEKKQQDKNDKMVEENVKLEEGTFSAGSTDFRVTDDKDTSQQFKAQLFSQFFQDEEAKTLSSIKIMSLPMSVSILNRGKSVNVGDIISLEEFTALNLRPLPNFSGTDSFLWKGIGETEKSDKSYKTDVSVKQHGSTVEMPWDLGEIKERLSLAGDTHKRYAKDNYKFKLSGKSNLSIRLSGEVSEELKVELRSSQGDILKSYTGKQGVLSAVLESGDYYIHITQGENTKYHLDIQKQQLNSDKKIFYVATNGIDSNPGTFEQPFKTIQKAASVLKAGETVYIRKGTYRENIRPQNSGTKGNSINYVAFAGEEVVVSALEELGDWETHDGSIVKTQWKSQFEEGNNAIFYNGKMMVEARWPNLPSNMGVETVSRKELAIADTGKMIQSPNQRVTGAISDGEFTNTQFEQEGFSNNFWRGAKLNSLFGWNWTPKTAVVTGNSGGKINFRFPFGGGKQYIPQEGNSFYLWGTLKALDVAKEWYHDGSTLYFYPPKPISGNTLVEAKSREWTMEVLQKQHLSFKNLTFKGGTIKVWRSSFVELENIQVLDAAHETLFDDPKEVWEGSGKSITIVDGNDNAVKNSRIDSSSGLGIFLRGKSHKISNNTISNVGYAGTNSAAIYILGNGHHIERNTFYGSGARLLNIDPKEGSVKIEYNEAFSGGRIAADFGAFIAFRSNGHNTEISRNAIHDMWAISNPALGYWGSAGIILELSKNYQVKENVIYNTSIEGFKYYDSTGVGSINVKLTGNTIDGDILFNAKNGSLSNTQFGQNIYKGSRIVPNSNGISFNGNIEQESFANIVKDEKKHNYELVKNENAGAFAYGKKAWIPGAMVSQQDLSRMNIGSVAIFDGKVTGIITGIPKGKKLPSGLRIKLGNTDIQAKVSQTYFDAKTALVTAKFEGKFTESQPGLVPVFFSLGSNDFIFTGSYFDRVK